MTESRPSAGSAFDLLRVVLAITGTLAFAGGFIGGIATVSIAGSRSASMTTAVLAGLGIILAGILLAVLLWALAAILGMLTSHLRNAAIIQTTQDDVRAILARMEQSLRSPIATPARTETSAIARPSVDHNGSPGLNPSWRDAADLLEQLCDIELLSDSQRQRWAQRHWARRKETHTELIERDVLIGEWTSAFSRLEDLEFLLPDDPEVKELRLSAEAEQNTRLEEDLRVARSQMRHLISTALWQQAEDLAAGLQMKYSGKPEAGQLIEQVRQERETYDRENAARLFREVAVASEKRQWRLALQNLEEFIRRYPGDPRAGALRMDMPTLQENAAAQERKEHEELFKDLLKRQRFEEAIGVARGLISKYPASPTAQEMSKLLPRVEEMSRQSQATAAQALAPAGAA